MSPYTGGRKRIMQLQQHSVTVLLFGICLGAALIFALGYFPLSFSDNVRASPQDLPDAIDDVSFVLPNVLN